MPDAVDLVRVSVRGAGVTGRRLRAAAEEIQDILKDEMEELGEDCASILRTVAPARSHRLQEGIVASATFRHARLTVDIFSEGAIADDGFDYTDVTRFGHRQSIIRPVFARFLRVRFPDAVVYRTHVRGYQPSTDWVEEALPEMEAAAEETMGRVDRQIDVRIGR